MGHRNAMQQPDCLPACTHIHTKFVVFVHRSVLFCSCLLFARMANGSIERARESRFDQTCVAQELLLLLLSSSLSTLSHTHRIQMRNENLMILFALLFASFRNLFILHSSIRSSVCSFVHLFVVRSFFHASPHRASCLSLCSHLFNEQTHDHY